MRSFLVSMFLLVVASSWVHAQDTFFQPEQQRILLLGDSNTFAGHYVTYLDVYLYTRFPTKQWELLNVGLPSETASGLSEPDHPFPRPNVHTRLDKALAMTKPNVVFMCYGMNDGIYHPFSQDRLTAYKLGMLKVIRKAQQAKAKGVVITTPPFDPVPVAKRLAPPNAKEFSYRKPFAGYDDVLARYSQFLLQLRRKDIPVVDVHTATNKHLQRMRKSQPKYRLAGDGIHPNHTGHWLMAAEILVGLKAPAIVADIEVDCKTRKVRGGRRATFTINDKGVTVTWQAGLPLPIDSRWPKTFPEKQRLQKALNRYQLTVRGLTKGNYDLMEGDQKLARVTAEALAQGIDLTQFPRLSTNQRAQQVLKLASQRQRILGRAWLSHIGHNRPNTPKGMSLDKAQVAADELDARIRKLVVPTNMTLRLQPV
ncbi:MAG: SGNH/GDSL hydrolase family protein [Gemmataceae bacterium]